MGLKIRKAEPWDIKRLVKMCRAAHNESPRYSRFVFNQRKAEEKIDWLCSKHCPSNFVVFVVEDADKRLTGAIALAAEDHHVSDARYVMDIFTYVKPAYRGGSTFIRLIDVAEQWAEEQRADELIFGVSSGFKVEKTLKLYARLGYKVGTANARKDLTV